MTTTLNISLSVFRDHAQNFFYEPCLSLDLPWFSYYFSLVGITVMSPLYFFNIVFKLILVFVDSLRVREPLCEQNIICFMD